LYWCRYIILALLLSACMPAMEFQSNDLRGSGVIYLPLPEGFTEGGAGSSDNVASSKYFAKRLVLNIEQTTQFRVIVDERLLPSGTLEERKTAAFSAANEVGADYAMVIKLGEYSNAASMSFRADSLTVKAIRIYDVESGVLAFGLKRPYTQTTSNITSLNQVLDSLAKQTAKHIYRLSSK
jgi:hypothetical protein